jgi:hypothetical protein
MLRGSAETASFGSERTPTPTGRQANPLHPFKRSRNIYDRMHASKQQSQKEPPISSALLPSAE